LILLQRQQQARVVCVETFNTGTHELSHGGLIIDRPRTDLDSGSFDLSDFLGRDSTVVQDKRLEAVLSGDADMGATGVPLCCGGVESVLV
jgi:hypothetical protein